MVRERCTPSSVQFSLTSIVRVYWVCPGKRVFPARGRELLIDRPWYTTTVGHTESVARECLGKLFVHATRSTSPVSRATKCFGGISRRDSRACRPVVHGRPISRDRFIVRKYSPPPVRSPTRGRSVVVSTRPRFGNADFGPRINRVSYRTKKGTIAYPGRTASSSA